MPTIDDRIRSRAHQIWEEEGVRKDVLKSIGRRRVSSLPSRTTGHRW